MTDLDRIRQLLRQGEGPTVEFKEARTDLPRSLFETICAFLNREGGTILLGVRDDGTVTGVDPDKVSKLTKDLVTTANSPEKLSPICMLFPEAVEIDDKIVLYLPVPPGSQVHRTKGHPYDRSADGDFKITDAESLRLMYLRKAAYFSENQVFPYLTLADFDPATLQRARRLAQVYRDQEHPWATMTDEAMLRSGGFWQRDVQTGKEGYTLAAALLFGTPQTLLTNVPQFFVDALLRRVDEDRYDDRDYIRDNLLNTYDRLINFVGKHLYDPFYLEGPQRISIRGVIFREVIVNLLAHREYSSGFTARMMIYRDRVVFENPNRAFHQGAIDPDTFTPRTKNPTLANFFKETGFMDQLGSGVRKVTKYIGAYANGKEAQFIEGDMFRTIIPLDERLMNAMVAPSADVQAGESVNKQADVLINVPTNVLISESSRQRIQGILTDIAQDKPLRSTQWADRYGVNEKTIRRDLEILRDANLIQFAGSKKSGRYVLTDIGRQQLIPTE
ncbi:RNA-binding domain-containing protein [Fibrella aquatilis]|uniref:DNA binding domain-containing protein n=1 Tax=Fibrella aquatilis TaxID=2817059 RepID=A0A939G752_9BACT|nr:RNA-binding domain-containing protein [Fibrella aquatilis]MBO0931874.1 putative DNA binding domain-containing protein [Fibrella aquatilis]